MTGESIVTVHVGPLAQPAGGLGDCGHGGHQPENEEPFVGVAVSVTTAPAGKVPSQGPPAGKSQSSPAGELTIFPDAE